MINTIYGTKSEMQQTFTKAGVRVPVTVVKVQPNIVVQVKSQEKDGYQAIQLGAGSRKLKGVNKPLLGHLRGAVKEKTAPRFLREVRTDSADYQIGSLINASDVLQPGDLVQVRGTSKGKGFAGGVKRWGFSGGPKTHGQSDRHRAPGSIGQGTTPGRVLKGKKMAGRMGSETVSVKNLRVLHVNKKTGELWLSGLVPGSKGGLLQVTKIGEDKKFQGLFQEESQTVENQADQLREQTSESTAEEPQEEVKDGSQE